MTSLAFILGVLPLALASGAGANSQRAIGTGVMGGMLTATVLAVFFVPVFYVGVRKLFPVGHVAPHGTPISAPRPAPQVAQAVPHSTGDGPVAGAPTAPSGPAGTAGDPA